MNIRQTLRMTAALLLVLVTIVPASAQRRTVRDRNSRADTYADVVEIQLTEPGTLEELFPKDMKDRVRILHIEGPIDEKDFKFIKQLCGRSRCVDKNGKKVDNYIDLELDRARIMGSSSGRSQGQREVLGDYLSYATHLTSILLPEHLKSIDNGALRGCSNLEEVIMPKGVRSLGNSAFSGCSRLEYVSLPEGLERIGDECFYDCDDLKSITIPSTVVEIGSKAFYGTGLKSVKLPSRLEMLGAKAFEGTPLTSLTIPAATHITKDDLGAMKKLERISVEKGNQYYTHEDGVLYDNTGSVLLLFPRARKGLFAVPDGVETITHQAFAGSALSGISMPASLTRLGDYAFMGSHLTDVVLPEGIETIPMGAFKDCSQLQSVKLPKGLTLVAESAFEDCSNLRSIDMPDGVTVILPKAFKHCKNLEQVLLPSALIGIGKSAFEGCAIRSIALPQGLLTIGECAFKSCKGLTRVVVPDACTMVGKEAFNECSSLSSIVLGNNIATIGEKAFRSTAISSIVLPASVQEVGKNVFEKCKSLNRIECRAVTPPKLSNVSNKKVEVCVPASAVPGYKKAKKWKDFKNLHAIN